MLILTTTLVGCSSSNTNQNDTINEENIPNQQTEIIIIDEEPKQITVADEEGVLDGKYKIQFGAAEKMTSEYINGDLLLVSYTFTNNADYTISPDLAVMVDAYQDGIEIGQIFDATLTGGNTNKSVEPGSSIECKALFMLSSDSDVEVEALEFLGMDGSMVKKVYKVQEIQ